MDDSSFPVLIAPRQLYIRIAMPISDNVQVQDQQQQRIVFLDVLPNKTFADVRTVLLEQFGPDIHPLGPDFYFCYHDRVKVMQKQEAQKRVWEFASNAGFHDDLYSASNYINEHADGISLDALKKPL